MNSDETKSRLPDLANEIREWLIGKYSRKIMSVVLVAVSTQMIHSALYEWGIAKM